MVGDRIRVRPFQGGRGYDFLLGRYVRFLWQPQQITTNQVA